MFKVFQKVCAIGTFNQPQSISKEWSVTVHLQMFKLVNFTRVMHDLLD